ncbi:MAG TPA: leukotriene A4 hydrolase C-terminal domain-containing protein, partial [Thermoanaerobaculia bacterium]|nr:leukotriene A4 hydrolase C-terminal domain-containing protein [Thermoanaerobaculia bacterium]
MPTTTPTACPSTRSTRRARSAAPLLLAAGLLALAGACAPSPEAPGEGDGTEADTAETAGDRRFPDDPHSFARPNEVAVRHLALDLTVDFDARRIEGRASLDLERHAPGADRVVLDTWGLDVRRVSLGGGAEARFELGEADEHLGRPLTVELGPAGEGGADTVHVEYATGPDARAVQWLTPEQTSSGKPFLFTQSQAILARSWIPLQDTPAVRFTYEALIRTPRAPEGLLALMSAENPTEVAADGVYRFEMPQAVPSYLMALAVGELEFREIGARSGVYAEPPVVERAAWEFADTERMIEAAEVLYGPYEWGRYDLLVLPPSFPFGGMENPRLTFVTPTLLAGDRSLVTLVAHELAHSWSGNLVTNANWNDFWLNEGFTVYLERRIMERLFGEPYTEMLWELGRQDLAKTIEEEQARDTWLHLDLAGRNPDDGMNDVAYEKGALLLRLLEETVGRERWDAFLKGYFDRFGFESMDSAGFLAYLERELLEPEAVSAEILRLDEWVYGPGVPDNEPEISSDAFLRVDARIEDYREGSAAADLSTDAWSTHEWLHFLRHLPRDLPPDRLAELDRAFELTGTGNSEVLAAWLELVLPAPRNRGNLAVEKRGQVLGVWGAGEDCEELLVLVLDVGDV